MPPSREVEHHHPHEHHLVPFAPLPDHLLNPAAGTHKPEGETSSDENEKKKKEEEKEDKKKEEDNTESVSKSVDKDIKNIKEFSNGLENVILSTVSNPGVIISSPLLTDGIVQLAAAVSALSSLVTSNPNVSSDIFYPNRLSGGLIDTSVAAQLTVSDGNGQSFSSFQNGEIASFSSKDQIGYSWVSQHKSDLDKAGIRVDLNKDGSFRLTNLNFKPEFVNGVLQDPTFSSFLAGQQPSYTITDPAKIKWVEDNKDAIASRGVILTQKGDKVVLTNKIFAIKPLDKSLFANCPTTDPSTQSFINGATPFVVGSDKDTMSWISDNKSKLTAGGLLVKIDNFGYSLQNPGFLPINISETAKGALGKILSFANLSSRVAQISANNAQKALQSGDQVTASKNANDSTIEFGRSAEGVNLVKTYLNISNKITSKKDRIQQQTSPSGISLKDVLTQSEYYINSSNSDVSEADQISDLKKSIFLDDYADLCSELDDLGGSIPKKQLDDLKNTVKKYLDAAMLTYKTDPDRAMIILGNLRKLIEISVEQIGLQGQSDQIKSLGLIPDPALLPFLKKTGGGVDEVKFKQLTGVDYSDYQKWGIWALMGQQYAQSIGFLGAAVSSLKVLMDYETQNPTTDPEQANVLDQHFQEDLKIARDCIKNDLEPHKNVISSIFSIDGSGIDEKTLKAIGDMAIPEQGKQEMQDALKKSDQAKKSDLEDFGLLFLCQVASANAGEEDRPSIDQAIQSAAEKAAVDDESYGNAYSNVYSLYGTISVAIGYFNDLSSAANASSIDAKAAIDNAINDIYQSKGTAVENVMYDVIARPDYAESIQGGEFIKGAVDIIGRENLDTIFDKSSSPEQLKEAVIILLAKSTLLQGDSPLGEELEKIRDHPEDYMTQDKINFRRKLLVEYYGLAGDANEKENGYEGISVSSEYKDLVNNMPQSIGQSFDDKFKSFEDLYVEVGGWQNDISDDLKIISPYLTPSQVSIVPGPDGSPDLKFLNQDAETAYLDLKAKLGMIITTRDTAQERLTDFYNQFGLYGGLSFDTTKQYTDPTDPIPVNIAGGIMGVEEAYQQKFEKAMEEQSHRENVLLCFGIAGFLFGGFAAALPEEISVVSAAQTIAAGGELEFSEDVEFMKVAQSMSTGAGLSMLIPKAFYIASPLLSDDSTKEDKDEAKKELKSLAWDAFLTVWGLGWSGAKAAWIAKGSYDAAKVADVALMAKESYDVVMSVPAFVDSYNSIKNGDTGWGVMNMIMSSTNFAVGLGEVSENFENVQALRKIKQEDVSDAALKKYSSVAGKVSGAMDTLAAGESLEPETLEKFYETKEKLETLKDADAIPKDQLDTQKANLKSISDFLSRYEDLTITKPDAAIGALDSFKSRIWNDGHINDQEINDAIDSLEEAQKINPKKSQSDALEDLYVLKRTEDSTADDVKISKNFIENAGSIGGKNFDGEAVSGLFAAYDRLEEREEKGLNSHDQSQTLKDLKTALEKTKTNIAVSLTGSVGADLTMLEDLDGSIADGSIDEGSKYTAERLEAAERLKHLDDLGFIKIDEKHQSMLDDYLDYKSEKDLPGYKVLDKFCQDVSSGVMPTHGEYAQAADALRELSTTQDLGPAGRAMIKDGRTAFDKFEGKLSEDVSLLKSFNTKYVLGIAIPSQEDLATVDGAYDELSVAGKVRPHFDSDKAVIDEYVSTRTEVRQKADVALLVDALEKIDDGDSKAMTQEYQTILKDAWNRIQDDIAWGENFSAPSLAIIKEFASLPKKDLQALLGGGVTYDHYVLSKLDIYFPSAGVAGDPEDAKEAAGVSQFLMSYMNGIDNGQQINDTTQAMADANFNILKTLVRKGAVTDPVQLGIYHDYMALQHQIGPQAEEDVATLAKTAYLIKTGAITDDEFEDAEQAKDRLLNLSGIRPESVDEDNAVGKFESLEAQGRISADIDNIQKALPLLEAAAKGQTVLSTDYLESINASWTRIQGLLNAGFKFDDTSILVFGAYRTDTAKLHQST